MYPGVTKLRTNLGWNIANNEKVNNQVNLLYQDLNIPPHIVKNAGAVKVLDANTLNNKEAKDRIYKAKVMVYKSGATAKGFPKEDLVVTLDGAKED